MFNCLFLQEDQSVKPERVKKLIDDLGDDLSWEFRRQDLQSLANAGYELVKKLRAAKVSDLNKAGLQTSSARLIYNANAPILCKTPQIPGTKLSRYSSGFVSNVLVMPVKPVFDTDALACHCATCLLLQAGVGFQRVEELGIIGPPHNSRQSK